MRIKKETYYLEMFLCIITKLSEVAKKCMVVSKQKSMQKLSVRLELIGQFYKYSNDIYR